MTIIRSDGLIWVAGKDGLAHARLDGPLAAAPRDLCGRLPLQLRYAWPIRSRCATCVAVAAGRKEGATAR